MGTMDQEELEEPEEEESCTQRYMWVIVGLPVLALIVGLVYWYCCSSSTYGPYTPYQVLLTKTVDKISCEKCTNSSEGTTPKAQVKKPDAKAKKCETCKDVKQKIKKGLNEFFKRLNKNAGERKLTPIKIKITADFKAADKSVVEKFPKEKNNGKLKAVFDALSKRDKFHQIFAIGATVTYKGKDGKDDPKSFTLQSTTIDVLAAAGEAKSKAKDKKSKTDGTKSDAKGEKSDAKTKESKAEVKTSKADTQTPKADDPEPVVETNKSETGNNTSQTVDNPQETADNAPATNDVEPKADTKKSKATGTESEDAAAVGEKSAKTANSKAAASKKSAAEDNKSDAKPAASNKKESRRLLPSEVALLRATRRRLPVMSALLSPFHQLQCA